MNGFISVYGIFVLDMSLRSALFPPALCMGIKVSMNTNMPWYLDENDAIIFGKSVHFV